MTRDEFITALSDDIRTAIPSNSELTSSLKNTAFNSVLGTMYTVDPSKKPTIKHITDLDFA